MKTFVSVPSLATEKTLTPSSLNAAVKRYTVPPTVANVVPFTLSSSSKPASVIVLTMLSDGTAPVLVDRVTVPLRSARSPPETVTSVCVLELLITECVPVVPATEKLKSVTFCTGSSKVTRQVRLSAFVGEVDGVWRSMEAIRGAVASGTYAPPDAWMLDIVVVLFATSAVTVMGAPPGAVLVNCQLRLHEPPPDGALHRY